MQELALWIKILFGWNFAGFIFLAILWANLDSPLEDNSLLHPTWLYKKFKINHFGCWLLTLIFNLLCPVVIIIYWVCKFTYFVCTVGRRNDDEA